MARANSRNSIWSRCVAETDCSGSKSVKSRCFRLPLMNWFTMMRWTQAMKLVPDKNW